MIPHIYTPDKMNYILSLQLNFLFARECFDIFFMCVTYDFMKMQDITALTKQPLCNG